MNFQKLMNRLEYSGTLTEYAFQQKHQVYVTRDEQWTLAATRRKLIGNYWLGVVLPHFIVLFLLSAFTVLLFNHGLHGILASLLPASALCFLILFISLYYPHYFLEFLPQLDNLMASSAGRQLEGLQKCKKAQYSVTTLMLIQTTLHHLGGKTAVLLTETHTKALSAQYGVSVRMIHNALHLIYLGKWDMQSERKRTEVRDAFEDAIAYFQTFAMTASIHHLKALQQKVLSQSHKKSKGVANVD
jgi:hypothetical protein